ncbi:MAG: fibronectin type III domain-containing protein [Steroidobacter sp.]
MMRPRGWALLPALIGALVGCSRSTPGSVETDAIRLTASLVSPVDIALEWHAPATGVAGHVLEYTNRPGTEDYVPLGFFPPNHTTFTHLRLIPETEFYYRVRPYFGPVSNAVEVSLPKELTAEAYAAAYALPEDYRWAPPAIVPESSNVTGKSIRNTTTSADAAPANLQAELVTHTVSGFKLAWTDRSNDEQGFFLEGKREGAAEYQVYALLEPNINSFGWAFEPPEKTGSFRIRAYYYGEPSNVVTLLTGKDPELGE